MIDAHLDPRSSVAQPSSMPQTAPLGRHSVKRIGFVGYKAVAAWRLKGVIKTGQSSLFGFLTGSDLYDRAGYGSPYPNDYVPRDRRRIATGGA